MTHENKEQTAKDMTEIGDTVTTFADGSLVVGKKRPAGTPRLHSALVKAQAMMRGVEKDGNNQHHGYRYASAEAMMLAALSVMRETGLAFTAIRTRVEPARGPCDAMLVAEYEMAHESGESKKYFSETPIHVGKGKLFDKALATAKTYDLSYTLRGAFTIPRVDEADERDSQDDAIIQAYASEQQKARVKAEAAARKEHAKNQKILKAKGERVNENGPEFFKAANVEWCTQNKIKFMVWASSADEWPGRGKIAQQIEIGDEALQFLMEWKQLDEIEALRQAHDFSVEINGAHDHDARAEAAFEASLEANK